MRPPTIELIDATRYAGNVGDKIRLVIYDEFDKNFEKIVSDHSLVQNTDLT